VPSSPLYFTDCCIPEENLIGAEGGGFSLVTEAFGKCRPIIGARVVELAQGATDLAVEYVRDHEAFSNSFTCSMLVTSMPPYSTPAYKTRRCSSRA